jgi:ABC-type dipeptide/oligopeptide/nickel transport system ATPase component
MNEPVLQLRHVSVDYPTRVGVVRGADDVSLTVYRGEVLGLVGESGCGKSTLGMAILRLLRPPGKIAGGEIIFDGHNLLELDDEAMRRLRGARVSMIFQDPMTCINHLQRVSDHMVETIRPAGNQGRADGRLPAPVERRHAPAGDDRAGTGAERRPDHR